MSPDWLEDLDAECEPPDLLEIRSPVPKPEQQEAARWMREHLMPQLKGMPGRRENVTGQGYSLCDDGNEYDNPIATITMDDGSEYLITVSKWR